jgi:hypothetical protein
MDRVGRLKESFDRYSRINCFINNSVGHLFREVEGLRERQTMNMRN